MNVLNSALLSGVLLSCLACQTRHIQGTFLQEGGKEELFFQKGAFAHRSAGKDTLNYGTYKQARRLLALSSPDYFHRTVFFGVSEPTVGEAGKLYIDIESPLQAENITYKVAANYSFQEDIFRSPHFVVKAEKGQEILIEIYTAGAFPKLPLIVPRILIVVPAAHIKSETGRIKIRIPELNKGYLTYKRLAEDYVRIISPDTLYWEGRRFVRRAK